MSSHGLSACKDLLRDLSFCTDHLAWSSYLLETRWASAREQSSRPSDLVRAMDERLLETGFPLDASHQNFIDTVCRHLMVSHRREVVDLDMSFLLPQGDSSLSPARAYLRFRALGLKAVPSPTLLVATLRALRNEQERAPGPSKIRAPWCLAEVMGSLSSDELDDPAFQRALAEVVRDLPEPAATLVRSRLRSRE